jgi:hypothetical protein
VPDPCNQQEYQKYLEVQKEFNTVHRAICKMLWPAVTADGNDDRNTTSATHILIKQLQDVPMQNILDALPMGLHIHACIPQSVKPHAKHQELLDTALISSNHEWPTCPRTPMQPVVTLDLPSLPAIAWAWGCWLDMQTMEQKGIKPTHTIHHKYDNHTPPQAAPQPASSVTLPATAATRAPPPPPQPQTQPHDYAPQHNADHLPMFKQAIFKEACQHYYSHNTQAWLKLFYELQAATGSTQQLTPHKHVLDSFIDLLEAPSNADNNPAPRANNVFSIQACIQGNMVVAEPSHGHTTHEQVNAIVMSSNLEAAAAYQHAAQLDQTASNNRQPEEEAEGNGHCTNVTTLLTRIQHQTRSVRKRRRQHANAKGPELSSEGGKNQKDWPSQLHGVNNNNNNCMPPPMHAPATITTANQV